MKGVLFCLIVVLFGWFGFNTWKSELANDRRVENDWRLARQLTITGYYHHLGYTIVTLAGTDSVLITQLKNPMYFSGSIRYIVNDSTSGIFDGDVSIRYYDDRGGWLMQQRDANCGDYLFPRVLASALH